MSVPPTPPGSDSGTPTWSSAYHAPVLASEVIALLGGSGRVLDCTLGGGGHSLALLESGVAEVFAVDRDPQALSTARERLADFERAHRFHAFLGNYARLGEISALAGPFDGILLDLGVSSHQIDAPERGFTFREGAALDMRMGTDAGQTARELLETAEERELARIFREYGDEPRARRLAREIVRRRATGGFDDSDDLVGAIRGALGPRTGPADFARLFQAVRIAVNDELAGLEAALPALRARLRSAGVLVVIAYHSGEDRLVKRAFRHWAASCICPPRQMVCTCRGRPLGTLLTRKAVVASPEEVQDNLRARSARLRAFRVWRDDE